MKNYGKNLIITLVISSLITMVSSTRAQHAGAAPLLASYFDLLVSGNYESAGYLWERSAQLRAKRLGITYKNIPVKMDCTSPIVQDLELMKNYLQPPVKRFEDILNHSAQKLLFQAIVDGKSVEHTYYAEFDGRHFWLTFPQDLYGKDWPVKETKYFRIHIHPDLLEYCNSLMLEEADRFVDNTGDSLGLTAYDMRHLESSKIEYFYCNNDSMVELMTGFRTRGIYDKASNDIISSFFPHFHEIAHLLVDYKLLNNELFVHPLVEEGLAVHYGGRWGKSTESLIPLGIFLFEQGIVSLDSMLDYSQFRSSTDADIAYPLAGLLNRYILELGGKNRYLTLYRKLSGTNKRLLSLPVDSVKSFILETVSIGQWEQFLTGFTEYLKKFKTDQYVLIAGTSGKGDTILSDVSFTVRKNGDWLEFDFVSNSDDAPKGNLIFGKVDAIDEFKSAMFDEHYENELPFDGFRYGVKYDSNEAGLYDYGTNVLLAKFIAGVEPSEDYYDESNHKVSFSIRKSLTKGVFPSENDYKLLNH